MSLYPNDLPVTEGLELVSILRNGELATKKAKFAYNVWLLQGFAQKTLIGEPTATDSVVLTPSAVQKPATNEEIADILEKLCVADVQSQATIPWELILRWALKELTTLLLAS